MHLLSDFVPPSDRPARAKLVSNTALFSYLIFVSALLVSFSTIRLKLPGILGFASNINSEDLLRYTNERRAQSGVGEVKLNPELSAAAEAKANYMFAHNFWAHVAPDGTQPWDFILGKGYDYLYAGENLAKDFQLSSGVVDAWMNSPSHKENLISPNYDDIGFAVVNGTLNGYETTLVVQMFGRRRGVNYLAEVDKQAVAAETTPVPATPVVKEEAPPEEKPLAVEEVALKQKELPEQKVTPKVELEELGNRGILPAFDIFAMSKTISLVLTVFIAGLFALDGIIAARRNTLRLSGHTFAHVVVLLAALIGIWYVNVGSIL